MSYSLVDSKYHEVEGPIYGLTELVKRARGRANKYGPRTLTIIKTTRLFGRDHESEEWGTIEVLPDRSAYLWRYTHSVDRLVFQSSGAADEVVTEFAPEAPITCGRARQILRSVGRESAWVAGTEYSIARNRANGTEYLVSYGNETALARNDTTQSWLPQTYLAALQEYDSGIYGGLFYL